MNRIFALTDESLVLLDCHNTLKLMIEIIIIMLYGAPIFTRRVAADSHSHHESAISNEEPHDVTFSPPDHYYYYYYYYYYLMKTNKISKK